MNLSGPAGPEPSQPRASALQLVAWSLGDGGVWVSNPEIAAIAISQYRIATQPISTMRLHAHLLLFYLASFLPILSIGRVSVYAVAIGTSASNSRTRAASADIKHKTCSHHYHHHHHRGDAAADDVDGSHRACSFFLWNLRSLINYKICTYLLRRNVYEASGGRKLVRIRPGSMLEWLYPASQYGPDRCAFCDQTFDDHLKKWGRDRGMEGTHFDQLIDKVYEEGVRWEGLDDISSDDDNGNMVNAAINKSKRYGRKGWRRIGRANMESSVSSLPSGRRPYRQFAFHKRYVEELIPNESTERMREKQQHQQQEQQRLRSSLTSTGKSTKEKHQWRRYPYANKVKSQPKIVTKNGTRERGQGNDYDEYKSGPIPYRIPKFRPPRGTMNLGTALMLLFAREIAIDEIDSLIALEQKENRSMEKKANPY